MHWWRKFFLTERNRGDTKFYKLGVNFKSIQKQGGELK